MKIISNTSKHQISCRRNRAQEDNVDQCCRLFPLSKMESNKLSYLFVMIASQQFYQEKLLNPDEVQRKGPLNTMIKPIKSVAGNRSLLRSAALNSFTFMTITRATNQVTKNHFSYNISFPRPRLCL